MLIWSFAMPFDIDRLIPNVNFGYSAAIYGLRNKKNVSVFILHPRGRVSPIQEAQMTTVLDPNVHNLAVEGTFDDCQVGLNLQKSKNDLSSY
jgi:threonine synthase